MCYEMKCSKCSMSTWGGCGRHLETVFKNIPYNKRCWCYYNQTDEELKELIKIYIAKKSSGPFPLKKPIK